MPSRRCSGTVDQEQSAERPERLAAEALLALLVDHDDALAGVGDFGCRDQARQARRRPRLRPHHLPSRLPPCCCAIEARALIAVNGKRCRCAYGAAPHGFVNLFQFGTFSRSRVQRALQHLI